MGRPCRGLRESCLERCRTSARARPRRSGRSGVVCRRARPAGRRRCLARHPETIRRSVDGAVRAFRRGAGDRNRPARRLLSRRVADLRRARPSLGKQRGAIPGRIRRLIMRDAVIVSTARTPLTKAGRGSFNNTLAPTLGAHSVRAAVERAGLEGGEIDDVLFGAAMQQGSQTMNVARLIALRAGLPVTVPGMSIDRQCSSGLMTIATAAKQIIVDRQDIAVAGGIESISKVSGSGKVFIETDAELIAMHKDTYMPMIGTAEVVAKRYNISREAQDEYSLQSQQRTAAAQAAGKFADEIVACNATMAVVRSEEHTSELQSLMRSSYAVFCLKKKKKEEKISYNL